MASHSAVVTEVQELAPELVQISVSVEDFRFQPGQWVNFRFPDGISRAYTIASPPEQSDAIQLCVRVGSGRGSAALTRLAAGDSVAVDGPFGSFLLPPDDGRPVVFLAGDTGIAPVRSIVLHMIAAKDARQIVVLYEPDHRTILYAADFDPLARSGAIVHESGKIDALVARNYRFITDATLMAVGFDPFLERVRAALAGAGVATGDVITESFGLLG